MTRRNVRKYSKYRAFSIKYVTWYHFCDGMHVFFMSQNGFCRTFAAKTNEPILNIKINNQMKNLRRLATFALLCMVGTILYAQKIEATGQVVDETGETVIGATVMEKGTTNGATTDIDGRFKLSVGSGARLVISYIGYLTQELPAAPGMKIVIKEDVKNLQEVVVTGYTTQRKADLTGAVSVVSVDELQKQN